jgi:hypothetical protein
MMEPMTPAAGQQPVVERFAHFAVESSAPGFVAMSFPQSAGKMWPADAVIGSQSGDGGSAARVQAYHLTRYGVSPSDQNDGWVQNRGYVSQGGRKVVCFSRALNAPEAAVVKSISPSTGGCNKVDVSCIYGTTTSISVMFQDAGAAGLASQPATLSLDSGTLDVLHHNWPPDQVPAVH